MNQSEIYTVEELAALLFKILPKNQPTNLDIQRHRRLEIAIRAHLGQSQAEICEALGCSKDTARYWMAIAKTNRADSWHEATVGRPKRVNDEYLGRLRELVVSNPQDHGYGFRRWTASWLSKHLARELGIEISDRHVNRLLKQMGLSTRNASQSENTKRDRTNQNEGSITIEDLSPAKKSQLEDLLWWFQNKI